MKVPMIKYGTWAALLLLCIFYAVRVFDFAIHDFANYYFGGWFMRVNNFTLTLYFPYTFNQAIVGLGYDPLFAGFAPNTPFLALLFIPVSFLPLVIAKLVFTSLSIVLFLYGINRLTSFYKVQSKYILLIPVLFFVPIKNEILFGQVYFLLFFFLAESWIAYEKGQLVRTAIFLSLAILLKVFPMLLLVVFAFRKQFRLLFYTLISGLLLILFTMFFSGWQVWLFYCKNVLSKAFNGGIASAYVVNYQSVFMFLKQLLVFDATENPSGFDHPILFWILLQAFKISIVTIGFFITKKLKDQLFVFSYWILAMILMSPYGSTYTFILMLFPFFAVIKSDFSDSKKSVLLLLMILMNNFPLRYFMDSAFPLSYLRLFALLLFFMLFLSPAYRSINWKVVSLVPALPLLVLFFTQKENPFHSVYALGKDAPLLIYDYKISNNRLTYFYWNQNGENTGTIAFEADKSVPSQLKGNQIFYQNRQLTFDDSNKRKPMLVNGRTIFYLSDLDRGIGFYTLRKIELR